MSNRNKIVSFLNAFVLGLFGASLVLPIESVVLVIGVLFAIVAIVAILRIDAEDDKRGTDNTRFFIVLAGVVIGALLAAFAPNFNVKELPEIVIIVWFIALWAANHI